MQSIEPTSRLCACLSAWQWWDCCLLVSIITETFLFLFIRWLQLLHSVGHRLFKSTRHFWKSPFFSDFFHLLSLIPNTYSVYEFLSLWSKQAMFCTLCVHSRNWLNFLVVLRTSFFMPEASLWIWLPAMIELPVKSSGRPPLTTERLSLFLFPQVRVGIPEISPPSLEDQLIVLGLTSWPVWRVVSGALDSLQHVSWSTQPHPWGSQAPSPR